MMSRIQTVILVFFAAWMATGCGISRRAAYAPPNTDDSTAPSAKPPTAADIDDVSSPAAPASSLSEVQVSLMQAYRDWKGTPYQLGGSSKKGVDCSQLVHVIYDEYLGISLPGTTRTQLNAGNSIRRSAIRTGDLIFFKTGRKTLHVGIAINHGEFLHASTSKGVMISKLGNSYWRNRFLAARRVL